MKNWILYYCCCFLFIWYLLREKNAGVKVKIDSPHQALALKYNFRCKYSGFYIQYQNKKTCERWDEKEIGIAYRLFVFIIATTFIVIQWNLNDDVIISCWFNLVFPSNWSRSFFLSFVSFFSAFCTHDSYISFWSLNKFRNIWGC